MTPQSVINVARDIVNDTDSAFYRQSNDELVRYFNLGLKEASVLMPNHFKTTGDFACTAGATEQAVTFTDAQELLGVIRIKNGKAVHIMDMEAIQRFNPDWASDAAGSAQNWAKIPNEKLRFYIYPKAPVEMQVLEVSYIRNPQEYALNDVVDDVPATWESGLAWYLIHMTEMKDDEHVNSSRGIAAYKRFTESITGVPSPAQG